MDDPCVTATVVPDGPLLAVDQRDIAVRDVTGPVTLDDPVLGLLTLSADGFADRVVWNPGPDATLGDVPPDGAAGFVCIESAQLSPVTLAPGETWTGRQTLQTAQRFDRGSRGSAASGVRSGVSGARARAGRGRPRPA